MSEENTHSIELLGGYTDKEGNTYTKVTFGRRLTAGDLMLIEDDPQSQIQTQHEELVRRRMITEFGTMKVPLLSMLLSLDRVDRQDLDRAQDEFARKTRIDRNAEFLPGGKVKLYFGFKIADEIYDIAEFGNRLSGNDDVEADRLNLRGVRRTCFELGRQISRLESSEHSLVLEGRLDIKHFETLDVEDLGMLRLGGELATQSFRFRRETISAERTSGDGVSTGEGIGVEGKRHSKSAK